jgi:SAM-dependent methyltransferase
VVGVRGFLKREGFDFDKKYHQIDKAFLKLFSKLEADGIQEIWNQMNLFGTGHTKLYSVPKTLEQAHLLMSYDRDRYLAGFEWLRARVEALKPKSVLEVGTGTGVLLRYLAANFPSIRYRGIDAEAALVNAAPAQDGVKLVVGDYLAVEAKPEFDLVICNFGFDSERFPASKTPHSVEQIGSSKFCPGCSDDLAEYLQAYFRAWRQWATDDASLLLTGRIGDFGYLRAIALASQDQGWTLDLDNSTLLSVTDYEGTRQRYPALQFRTHGISGSSLEDIERFLVSSS